MANLKSKTLFFTTSPRTPLKMIPEIEILNDSFVGRKWDKETQVEFAQKLSKDKYFEGRGSQKNMDFSARDRINRSPKALGFVDLKPYISVTEPGELLLGGKGTEEILLRQLLKFQLPSPYHKETDKTKGLFRVKPYLEIFRLIYELGSISFDELMIFGMQITDYHNFDNIVEQIKTFRRMKVYFKGSYRNFRGEYLLKEIERIYQRDIDEGQTKTRESRDKSVKNFVQTKSRNLRDYADACFRYLRATGMVEISQRGHSLSITPEKRGDVEYFLHTLDREPVFVDDEKKYKEYLFDAALPKLYSDNAEILINKIVEIVPDTIGLDDKSIEELKDILDTVRKEQRERIITNQVNDIKDCKKFSDVMTTFQDINNKDLYDLPLMLEWNVWRAMTMIDGGDIKANLRFDDKGQPMSTAPGNMADILCDYGEFGVTVEVTMQSGQRQYEMEGEPVSRHLAKLKQELGKDAYCFFIAPSINPSCIAYFYTLHRTNIAYYGGISVIVPIELNLFISMVERSYQVDYVPNSSHIREIFEYSKEQAEKASDENEWYKALKDKILNWL